MPTQTPVKRTITIKKYTITTSIRTGKSSTTSNKSVIIRTFARGAAI